MANGERHSAGGGGAKGADRGPVWALGAMSGTSLDGVDAAMLHTDGRHIAAFGPSRYRAFEPAERATIRAALGRWPGEDGVAAAAEVVETVHARLLSRFALSGDRSGPAAAPDPAPALIGFHGQTLAHDPDNRRTHQAGDGAVLAEILGLPVVWDFRSADMALGGQGAPLAPFFHHACARAIGAEAPVVVLNLGGVGNLTWIDPRRADPAEPGALVAFDTGPANAPIDDLISARLGRSHDAGGSLALRGQVSAPVVDAALSHAHFLKMPPKSLDRDAFRDLGQQVAHLSDADAAATLIAIAAMAVAEGLTHCPEPPARILVTGGGRHNAAMMAALETVCDCPVAPVEMAGLDGDMLEAQAFAFLAVRVLRGMPTSGPGTTGVAAPVGGGRLSRPGEA